MHTLSLSMGATPKEATKNTASELLFNRKRNFFRADARAGSACPAPALGTPRPPQGGPSAPRKSSFFTSDSFLFYIRPALKLQFLQ